MDRLRGTSQGGRPAVGANVPSGHWRTQGQGAGVQAPAPQWSRVAAWPCLFRVTGCAGCAASLPLRGPVEATGSPCGSGYTVGACWRPQGSSIRTCKASDSMETLQGGTPQHRMSMCLTRISRPRVTEPRWERLGLPPSLPLVRPAGRRDSYCAEARTRTQTRALSTRECCEGEREGLLVSERKKGGEGWGVITQQQRNARH